MRLSPSGISVWNECSQKFHYAYVRGLKAKEHQKFFDKGLYIHSLAHTYYHTLELGYEAGSDFAINFMNSRFMSDMRDSDGSNVATLAQIIPLMKRYVANYSKTIDSGIEIIEAEKEFFVEFEGITLHGIIDLLYRKKGRIRIRDHKSSEKPNTWKIEEVPLHGQLLHYLVAMELELKEEITDVEINFILSYAYKEPKPINETFKLLTATHARKAIETYKENLIRTHEQIVTSEPIRVYGQACKSCQFKTLCLLEAKGMSTEIALSSFVVKLDEPTPKV